jgi:hypothetical protein
MPTLICFSGVGGDAIAVEETPEQVLRVLNTGRGTPLLLTRDGAHEGVYINPGRIACWYPTSGDDVAPRVVPRPFRGTI